MTHLVLLFLVVVAAVQSGACPTMCTCENKPRDVAQHYYTSVKCNGYHKNITFELEDTTRDLEISNLDESQLELIIQELLDEEIRLPYFTELIITHSVIPDGLKFSDFSRLQLLSLSANNINNFTETFINVSSLQNLDLSRNSFVSLTADTFRTLQNLEVLNLSANCLNKISFSNLITLKCLDLSENNLTELDNKVFAPLTSLQYLNLSQNHLEVLNEECFSSLLKLQQLDVSGNRLNRVELGSLQLPSLARLILSGNRQLGTSREPPFIVGTGQRLQTVDASRIGLKQVPAALTHSIRTLRLAGNTIKIVRCGDLDSYPLLQLLDFNSNGLKSIEDDALGRLDSLSILYLTDNTMKEIPKSLSEKLKVLHLEHNVIEKIGSKDLQGLMELEVLLLKDNKIKVIEEEAFGQLVALVTLDLSQNPIKILQAGCLSSSMALQVLRMSSIASISPAQELSFPLSATEHLITLDLSRSPGLARQLLVDTAALAASRELQELDLSFTDLDYIRSDLLHFLPQLRIFHIQGNRINCTQLEWLGAWMRRQDEPEYKKISCASPPELWGTLLIDLQDTEMMSFNYISIPTTTKTIQIKKAPSTSEIPIDNQTFEDTTKTTSSQPLPTPDILIKTKNKSAATSTQLPPSHLESHANQPLHNKPARESGKTEIPGNLFIASKEKTFNNAPPPHNNNKLNELFPEVPSVTSDVDVNSNSSHEHRWNASTSNGEMSMFSAGDHHQGMLHPSMFILAAGILAAAAALIMLATRFTRRRRSIMRLQQEEDIEVSNMPGVTELW